MSAAGFTAAKADNIRLEARQALRFDVALTVSGSETVTVNATDAGTINTDNAGISASLSPEAVLDLPGELSRGRIDVAFECGADFTGRAAGYWIVSAGAFGFAESECEVFDPGWIAVAVGDDGGWNFGAGPDDEQY